VGELPGGVLGAERSKGGGVFGAAQGGACTLNNECTPTVYGPRVPANISLQA
jgi:hypothetical protein